METSILDRNSYNVLNLCVDENQNSSSKWSIKVYSGFLEKPLEFMEISQVLLTMDEIFDTINFPQASTEARRFAKDGEPKKEGKESKNFMSQKEISERKGSKGTFVVHVQYRQNATWQGSVVWAEKNITRNFRSALELLKLIDGALDEIDEGNNKS